MSNRTQALNAARQRKAALAKALAATAHLTRDKSRVVPIPNVQRLELLGGSASSIRSALRKPGLAVVGSNLQPKSMSRLPGQWSDRVHTREKDIAPVEYMPEHWLALNARGLRFNPNPWVKDFTTLRVWEFSDKLGKPITKTKRIDMGQYRQAPVSELLWRGPPSLFDECQAIEPKRVIGAKFHEPVGKLPPWRDAVPRAPTAREIELEALINDWRGRQQLAYLEALGVSV